MAETNLSCSVEQGFNYQKDAQVLVGHITYLKIGDQELKADLEVTDPENNANLVKVVGVANFVGWNGGYAEPVQFACQVSNANKVSVATLTHKSLSNTEVLFKFNIYDFDPGEKKYFKCFHSGDVQLKGLVQKAGGSLEISIANDQSMEVVSPKNFTLQMGVMPQEVAQSIMMATSVSQKFVKKWGVAVG